MDEPRETDVSEVSLLKEEVINDLDSALTRFTNGEMNGLELLAGAVNAWNKAVKNEALRRKMEEEIVKRERALYYITGIPEKSDDEKKVASPVRQRLNPNYWLAHVPEELKYKEEVYILDKIKSLRTFFEALR